MIGRILKQWSSALAIVALAATFTAAPAAIGYGPFDAAAYAKGKGSGKGGGKGNGLFRSGEAKAKAKSRGGSGNGAIRRSGLGREFDRVGRDVDRAIGRVLGTEKKKSRTTRTAKAGPKAATTETVDTEVEVTAVETPLEPLRANQKGKWNAANANQRALDAHIRNEKFNGTIGALSYYQLAGKAASGAELNEYEQRALDNILAGYDADIPDDELAMLINSGEEGAPVYEVTDGIAECVENCDEADVDGANNVITSYYDDAARLDFLADAEQRIIDDSNKPTEGIEDQLLDELANDLGFERFDPYAEDPEVDDEVVILPDDEVIVVVE